MTHTQSHCFPMLQHGQMMCNVLHTNNFCNSGMITDDVDFCIQPIKHGLGVTTKGDTSLINLMMLMCLVCILWSKTNALKIHNTKLGCRFSKWAVVALRKKYIVSYSVTLIQCKHDTWYIMCFILYVYILICDVYTHFLVEVHDFLFWGLSRWVFDVYIAILPYCHI